MRQTLLFIGLLVCLGGHAQRTEYGQWYALSVGTKVAQGLNASFKTQLRTGYDGLILSAWNHDLELTYKLTDRFRLEATYRLGNSYNLENWQWRHRYQLGFRIQESVGEWEVDWKTRAQWRPVGVGRETGDLSRSLTWRNRFTAERKLIKRTWLAASVEAFHVPQAESLALADLRARLKLKRKLDKRLYGSLGAMYQTETASGDPVSEWVVQFSLQWEWKPKK